MELQEQIKKIQQNKALVQQLMTSPDGQRLLAMLTKDGGGQLNQAAAAAAKGNTADIVHMLAKVSIQSTTRSTDPFRAEAALQQLRRFHKISAKEAAPCGRL